MARPKKSKTKQAARVTSRSPVRQTQQTAVQSQLYSPGQTMQAKRLADLTKRRLFANSLLPNPREVPTSQTRSSVVYEKDRRASGLTLSQSIKAKEKKEPVKQSLATVRENIPMHCKKRPKSNRPNPSGSGRKTTFIPWC